MTVTSNGAAAKPLRRVKAPEAHTDHEIRDFWKRVKQDVTAPAMTSAAHVQNGPCPGDPRHRQPLRWACGRKILSRRAKPIAPSSKKARRWRGISVAPVSLTMFQEARRSRSRPGQFRQSNAA